MGLPHLKLLKKHAISQIYNFDIGYHFIFDGPRNTLYSSPASAMSQLKKRKLCVMGYSRVGKSSLTIQFVHNNFPDSYEPTIANTFNKRFQINNNHYSLEVCSMLIDMSF